MENLRVKTGIEGLDSFIEGGFPKGRVYLVAGETGTGKTTFALQYLYFGVEYGDSGVYVTIDEKPERIVEDALTLGWNLEKLMDENRLLMVELSPYFSDIKKVDAFQIAENLRGYINEIEAKRLAIDPIAPLVARSDEPLTSLDAQMYVRNYLRKLFHALEELGVTTVGTSEIPTGTKKLSRYGVEEFLASGIVVLKLQMVETGFRRELYIRKMRGVNHNMGIFPFIIQPGRGIIISV